VFGETKVNAKRRWAIVEAHQKRWRDVSRGA
jgi:hypothetical protein